jgi:hypothetical protein
VDTDVSEVCAASIFMIEVCRLQNLSAFTGYRECGHSDTMEGVRVSVTIFLAT